MGNKFLLRSCSTRPFKAELTDLCYGYCAFHRRYLERDGFAATGFEIEAEMTVVPCRLGCASPRSRAWRCRAATVRRTCGPSETEYGSCAPSYAITTVAFSGRVVQALAAREVVVDRGEDDMTGIISTSAPTSLPAPTRQKQSRAPRPRVSICIPAYQAGRHLTATLESALGQDYEDFEIVVIDNNSTDDTSEILDGSPIREFACCATTPPSR